MTTPLIFIFLITSLFIPVMFCAGFYYGFSTAQSVLTHHVADVENIPTVKAVRNLKIRHHAETDQERLRRILAENVENYGTDIPQKEVI